VKAERQKRRGSLPFPTASSLQELALACQRRWPSNQHHVAHPQRSYLPRILVDDCRCGRGSLTGTRGASTVFPEVGQSRLP
jgi:hypothetical protein